MGAGLGGRSGVYILSGFYSCSHRSPVPAGVASPPPRKPRARERDVGGRLSSPRRLVRLGPAAEDLAWPHGRSSLGWHKAPGTVSIFRDAKHAGYLSPWPPGDFAEAGGRTVPGEAPGAGKELGGLRWRLLSG